MPEGILWVFERSLWVPGVSVTQRMAAMTVVLLSLVFLSSPRIYGYLPKAWWVAWLSLWISQAPFPVQQVVVQGILEESG